ncbi:penicillin-binding transpeptidase domain-containing protein [Streptomyces qinglanensis]|uniref:Penicillin binding protein transpeptidase domain-containing protein n=1 Tax=Streptomyces qinglanensis TaxID=943816 RepID=A0A1H9N3Z5_9ACTN|nr:penicillin-binding transpeptidase domain-containing protein [Streptomyces qinglanensis]SER30561.1 Penicillin binding protein transpeptidase domain-containing protein [Streptomyces qinglanensis]
MEKGTGTHARTDGVTVGGKTARPSTRVDNSGTPYAWFTSFGETGSGRKVAVAVRVEDSDAARAEAGGSGPAAPVARKMREAALR